MTLRARVRTWRYRLDLWERNGGCNRAEEGLVLLSVVGIFYLLATWMMT